MRLVIVQAYLAVFYLGLSIANAQLSTHFNTTLTTANGLPNNSITGVEQDRAGFIWIATYDGLARYDGRTVKVFRNRPGDSLSLADNHITELVAAPDGTFILNMDSGTVQQFDPTTERFTTLLHRQFMDRNKVFFNRIQLSVDGKQLWGLLPGVRLVNFDIQRKTFRVFNVPALVGSLNELHHFLLTPSGYIYGETLAGLLQFDTRTGHKRIIPFPFQTLDREREMNFQSLNNHQIAMGPGGQIAVFGFHVIAIYDPLQDRFRTVPIPQVANVETSQARKMATTISYALKTLADNHLYVGYRNRLYRFDDPNQLTLIRQEETVTSRLAPWLIDQSGVRWVSDEATGLIKQDLHPLPFSFLPKRRSFGEDLLEQDLGVTLPESYEVWDNDNWPRYTMDHTGIGYLIDPSRVYRYTVANHTLTEMAKFAAMDSKICCKQCLKTDGRIAGGQRSGNNRTIGTGLIWVYNNRRGLIAVSSDETKVYAYPNSQLPLRALNPGFDAGDIQPIGQSVWIGGQHELGLFRYDLRHKRLDKPILNGFNGKNLLAEQTINCLSADPTDSTKLWIGTEGGLCWLDTHTMRYQRLGGVEGFPTIAIQSMETDDQGKLWCGTNRGLLRLSHNIRSQSLTWQHITTNDGLTEDGFRPNSSAHLPDGRLVFGTANGRIIFDPSAIRDRGYEPPIVLASLRINNRLIEVNKPNSPLVASLNSLSELILDHTQNFLTITFAGLDYGKAEKLSYRYKLADVDTGWVEVGPQNTANYTQLAPGCYLFSVNSTTADGRWSPHIKQLQIVITPPFWATWWAYLVYALALGGLVLGFIRFRTRQIWQQQEIRLKQQEAEQLRSVDELKTRFFSNIAHELRTPLALIISPLDKLLEGSDLPPIFQKQLTTIQRNTQQLLRLVNQLLDINKLEAQQMDIINEVGDLPSFVERIVELFRPSADRKQLTLTYYTDMPPGNYLFDASKWESILFNLISNAIKFTEKGGIIIRLTRLPAAVHLVVSDTGIGIPVDKLPYIFDRFYQIDNSLKRSYEGTGIGLALVKELAHRLGGTIQVRSQVNGPTGESGTEFFLELPIQKLHDLPEIQSVPVNSTGFDLFPLSNSSVVAVDQGQTADMPLILVVEDNAELREFIVAELTPLYRIHSAANGYEGWVLAKEELPDIIISDLMMPHMDGYALTEKVKSDPDTDHIAMILLTASLEQKSLVRSLEYGADEYITKPFSLHELRLRLRNLLTRQYRLQEQFQQQFTQTEATAPLESVQNEFLQRLYHLVEQRLADSTLSVEWLADQLAMSRKTLYLKVQTILGISTKELIRQYRLRKAVDLLQAGHSVSQTAYLTGFESPAYFTKTFREFYKKTPTEFLKK